VVLVVSRDVSTVKCHKLAGAWGLHVSITDFPATCHPVGFLLRGTQEGGKRVRTAKEARNGFAMVGGFTCPQNKETTPAWNVRSQPAIYYSNICNKSYA